MQIWWKDARKVKVQEPLSQVRPQKVFTSQRFYIYSSSLWDTPVGEKKYRTSQSSWTSQTSSLYLYQLNASFLTSKARFCSTQQPMSLHSTLSGPPRGRTHPPYRIRCCESYHGRNPRRRCATYAVTTIFSRRR